MPLPGPLIVISESPAGRLIAALGKAGAFPVVETRWVDAATAMTSIRPAGVIIAEPGNVEPKAAATFWQAIARAEPYVPAVACIAETTPVPHRTALAIPADAPAERLIARLSSALRARDLHATVLRRAQTLRDEDHDVPEFPSTDPLEDATVLVLGRGRSYPTLSVLVGERVGVIGALSVEAAGRYLAAREVDGIVIGDGFSPKIVEAFLTVLADDPRFRDLATGVLGNGTVPGQMPNIVQDRDPPRLVERLLPLVRVHSFAARLRRMLKSLECNGMLDPETGLMHEQAFGQDLTRAIANASEHGSGLSIARFSFGDAADRRTSFDAARLFSRLMRKADFACRQDDGSILTAFTGTDLRAAHVVARRLASTLKHTMLRADQDAASAAPSVTLATLKPTDTVLTLMARVSPRTVAAE